MTLEELTQLAAVQQTILTRHDREMAEFRESLRLSSEQHRREMAEFRESLKQQEEVRQQFEEQHQREMAEFRESSRIASDRHQREMAEFRESLKQQEEARKQFEERHQRSVEATQRLADLNQEQLNQLTAGLLELRILVANYLQGRSSLDQSE
ncbi:MAG: hypothetical protein IGS48_11200 [Oscillatoriales cyanobacterium C42_A2020_001]|nr:hypothetical protein [Leptolyngbyaceae cyanobacterium C42_A2020_001]